MKYNGEVVRCGICTEDSTHERSDSCANCGKVCCEFCQDAERARRCEGCSNVVCEACWRQADGLLFCPECLSVHLEAIEEAEEALYRARYGRAA